ncbi:MAG TPA: hypothetical protein ENI23_17360 [bacterium]|nr:hypothetical protein [bacterium]
MAVKEEGSFYCWWCSQEEGKLIKFKALNERTNDYCDRCEGFSTRLTTKDIEGRLHAEIRINALHISIYQHGVDKMKQLLKAIEKEKAHE